MVILYVSNAAAADRLDHELTFRRYQSLRCCVILANLDLHHA